MKLLVKTCFCIFSTAVSTVARSATANVDYTPALSGTADFEANGDTEAMVTLTIMNDVNIESTEQLELTLTVPVAAGVVGEVGKAVVNILDDDVAPVTPSMFKFKVYNYLVLLYYKKNAINIVF